MFFGMTGFGASGPYKQVYDHFGLTSEKITSVICGQLGSLASKQKG
jgi:transketolase